MKQNFKKLLNEFLVHNFLSSLIIDGYRIDGYFCRVGFLTTLTVHKKL